MAKKLKIVGSAVPNMPWEDKPAGCPGTIYLPQADPGFLCIYRQFENGLSAPTVFRFASASAPDNGGAEGPFSGPMGAYLDMAVTGTGVHLGRGTWAVTSS